MQQGVHRQQQRNVEKTAEIPNHPRVFKNQVCLPVTSFAADPPEIMFLTDVAIQAGGGVVIRGVPSGRTCRTKAGVRRSVGDGFACFALAARRWDGVVDICGCPTRRTRQEVVATVPTPRAVGSTVAISNRVLRAHRARSGAVCTRECTLHDQAHTCTPLCGDKTSGKDRQTSQRKER